MFSFKVLLISSLCIIFAYFICSTSGIGRDATKISTLAENAKLFLNKVKELDGKLKLPKSMKKFDNIRYKRWIRNIRCRKSQVERFIAEFKKLADYTDEVVNDYLAQFKAILKTREVGNGKKRDKLCEFYRKKILPKFTIVGSGKNYHQVIGFHSRFTNKLADLHNEISNMKSPTGDVQYEYEEVSCSFFGCLLL